MSTWMPRIIIALATLGIIDTAYLYISRLRGDTLACGILDGCNVVAASPYSYLFGVPLSLLGLIFYTGVLCIGIAFHTRWARYAPRAFYIAAGIGLILSFCFSCIQVFLIGAYCIYCIISAIICSALAVIAICMWQGKKLS